MVIFSPLFACLVISYWTPTIGMFTSLGAKYFCIPLNMVVLRSGMQFSYLETVWYVQALPLSFVIGRIKAVYSLRLVPLPRPHTQIIPFWVVCPILCVLWLVGMNYSQSCADPGDCSTYSMLVVLSPTSSPSLACPPPCRPSGTGPIALSLTCQDPLPWGLCTWHSLFLRSCLPDIHD